MNHKKVSFQELIPLIEEKMKTGESFSFLAFGTSMLPFIRNGKDIVTLSPCSKNLKKNDVIFYRRTSGQFVLHRITKVRKNGELWLCGDNQILIEKEIFPEQVIAILTKLERDGKEIALHSFPLSLYLLYLPIRRFVYRVLIFIKRMLKRVFNIK